MTARHQLRIGNRRLGRDRAPIDATPAPRVGEMLQSARERKGVDLFRAERDTKIRLRYLSALEDGAYEDLPPPVYTKGFLRNYAIYLGLDPEELLERWRDEMEGMRSSERVIVAPPPRPLAAPGRRVTLTPGMLVGGLVALVFLAFIGYLGMQLLRYVETTPVGLTNPANVFSQIDAESIVLEGTAGPGALITIHAPGETLYNTNANQDGNWTKQVPLARGRNDFTIVATDPVTQRDSATLGLTIAVPLPSAVPGSSPSAAPPAALALTLLGPPEGFVTTDSQVLVRGTTTGSRITIESEYLGTPGSTPIPSPGTSPVPSATPTVAPTPTRVPASSPIPTPGASLPPIGPARDITVAEGGIFEETLTYPLGRWQLTVTAFGIGVAPISQTRTVTAALPTASEINLFISIESRDSWVHIVADGIRVPGYGSRTMHVGETVTVTALNEICLRAGNAGALHLTLNGLDIGPLGSNGDVGNWVIRPGLEPEPSTAAC